MGSGMASDLPLAFESDPVPCSTMELGFIRGWDQCTNKFSGTSRSTNYRLFAMNKSLANPSCGQCKVNVPYISAYIKKTLKTHKCSRRLFRHLHSHSLTPLTFIMFQRSALIADNGSITCFQLFLFFSFLLILFLIIFFLIFFSIFSFFFLKVWSQVD